MDVRYTHFGISILFSGANQSTLARSALSMMRAKLKCLRLISAVDRPEWPRYRMEQENLYAEKGLQLGKLRIGGIYRRKLKRRDVATAAEMYL